MSDVNELLLKSNSWIDLVENLSEFGSDSLYKKFKGDVFERLSEFYFRINPAFTLDFSKIWHHSELPIEIRDYLDLPNPEIGIDLIAQYYDQTYCAIQCKFHQDPAVNVSYDELSTFFSITERTKTYSKLSHRIIVTSAENVGNKVLQLHKEKLGVISGEEFRSLDSDFFSKLHQIIMGKKIIFLPFTPRYHQREAVECAIDYYCAKNRNRGKIIHPCGSGKSLTAYWLAKRLGVGTVIIAVPSLALVKQTLNTWTREAIADNLPMEWKAICSDQDVTPNDDLTFRTQDIGVPVTTDSSKIREFLSRDFGGVKLIVTTYQSGSALIDACKEIKFRFDLGIFDEAHKTAGHRLKKFAELLDDNKLMISKRVFMTATERQFKGDSNDFISMDDHSKYGDIVHQLSFKSAIEQVPPILSDYKIVTVVVRKSEIKELILNNSHINIHERESIVESEATTFAALIALSKLIGENKTKHAITFHSSIKRAKLFKKISDEISLLPNSNIKIKSFHVSGKMTTGQRNAEIARFMRESPSVISNARCLTEGVDIPSVDTVVFADPKQSVIDIVQAAGRAMRTHPDKDIGYIVIPVLIDEESGDASADVFRQLITIIAALGIHDERVIEEAKKYVSKNKITNNRILEFVEMSPSISLNFEEMIREIEIKTWDRLSFAKSVVGESQFAKWMEDYTDLGDSSIKKYCNVVRKISNDLIKKDLTYSSLNDIIETDDLEDLKEKYFSIPEFDEQNKRGNSMYSAGFNKMIEYQKSQRA